MERDEETERTTYECEECGETYDADLYPPTSCATASTVCWREVCAGCRDDAANGWEKVPGCEDYVCGKHSFPAPPPLETERAE